MKIICFYLPQFHTIPENDIWWGKGFTEWTNTKRSKPLFKGHYQPREPHNDFYYDLTNPNAREWQADLAKRYGVYGFCYYHYWFKGKRLLDKPFNEVLRLGEPDFPFCLSWANEPWTRRWDGQENQILMPQDYGDESDWEEHFNYLLKAFKDKRYIKVDNKPIFIIYRSASIDRCDDMLDYWNNLAKENGLKGIHFVKTLTGFKNCKFKRFNASIEFEPFYTLKHDYPFFHKVKRKLTDIYRVKCKLGKILGDYDKIWSRIITRSPKEGKVYLGAFVDWDNTPRRGYHGSFMSGSTPCKFEYYLGQQIKRAKSIYKSEFIFINAWNEWAEGTYLEPDKKFGYGYLEAVSKAILKNE